MDFLLLACESKEGNFAEFVSEGKPVASVRPVFRLVRSL
jgi:hypothetical protein